MGIVSTNVFVIGSGSGSAGGANGADLPTRLKSISANGGNKFVTLTLGYENTDLVTGVQVNFKTGSYPTSPTDGQSMTVSGAATSIKVMGLTNKLTYYFRVFLYREVDGVIYYQTDVTNSRVTCIPRAVEITGVVPTYSASNYIGLESSCSFELTAPAGTRILLGGGGQDGKNGYGVYSSSSTTARETGGDGGSGGLIYQFTLPDNVIDEQCILTIGTRNNLDSNTARNTTLKIGSKTYSSASGSVITVNTPIGYIGGNGGAGGGAIYGDKYHSSSKASDGEGAGGGGGGGTIDDGTKYKAASSTAGNSKNGGGGGGAFAICQYTAEWWNGTPGTGYKNGGKGSTYTIATSYGETEDDDGDYENKGTQYLLGGAGGHGQGNNYGESPAATKAISSYGGYHCDPSPGICYAGGNGGAGGYSGGGGGGGSAYAWGVFANIGKGGKGGNGICIIQWEE